MNRKGGSLEFTQKLELRCPVIVPFGGQGHSTQRCREVREMGIDKQFQMIDAIPGEDTEQDFTRSSNCRYRHDDAVFFVNYR